MARPTEDGTPDRRAGGAGRRACLRAGLARRVGDREGKRVAETGGQGHAGGRGATAGGALSGGARGVVIGPAARDARSLRPQRHARSRARAVTRSSFHRRHPVGAALGLVVADHARPAPRGFLGRRRVAASGAGGGGRFAGFPDRACCRPPAAGGDQSDAARDQALPEFACAIWRSVCDRRTTSPTPSTASSAGSAAASGEASFPTCGSPTFLRTAISEPALILLGAIETFAPQAFEQPAAQVSRLARRQNGQRPARRATRSGMAGRQEGLPGAVRPGPPGMAEHR